MKARARALCLALLTLVGGFALGSGAHAADPGRVALVIGNAGYDAEGWALDAPQQDAALIAQALGEAGFDAELVIDADADVMNAAIRRFGGRLAAEGADAVGFFYYAGYAVRHDGLTYFLPVDTAVDRPSGLGGDTPRLDLLVDYMTPLQGGRGFVVLDACRAAPWPEAPEDAASACAPPEAEPGYEPLVAYAAAGDLVGAESAYAQALAAALRVRGLTAGDVFEQAAARTAAATEGGQRPWLVRMHWPAGLFFLSGAPVEADYGARVAESVRWDYARRSGTADAYRGYLAAYPEGRFVGEALTRIAALAPSGVLSGLVASSEESVRAEAADAGTRSLAEAGAPAPPPAVASAGPAEAGEAVERRAFRSPDLEDVLVVETEKGRIIIEMMPELAPEEVARVRELAREGYFDGAPFRRVVEGFRAEVVLRLGPGEGEIAALPADLLAPAAVTPAPVEVADRDRNRLGVYAGGDISFGLYKGMPMATSSGDPDAASWATHCPGVASMGRENGADPVLFIMRGEAPGLDGGARPWGRVLVGLDVLYDLAVGDPLTPGFTPDRIFMAYVASDVEDPSSMGGGEAPDGPGPLLVPAILDERGPAFAGLVTWLGEDLGRAPRVCEVRLPLSPAGAALPADAPRVP